jgi:hypothetical protein
VERGEKACVYCSTNEMQADFLTKAVPVQKFVDNRNGMGIEDQDLEIVD